MSTLGSLLDALSARGVRLAVDGDSLRIDAPAGELRPRDVATIRRYKPYLLRALRPPRCSQHIDPALWTSSPAQARPGWVRVTCRECSGFVGYHPILVDRN